MKISILSQNSTSAGISNQALSTINKLIQKYDDQIEAHLPNTNFFRQKILSKKSRLYFYPVDPTPWSFLKRIVHEMIIIPTRVYKSNSDAILIFANYSIIPYRGKKIVIVRHPYLLDDELYKNLNLFSKCLEWLRRKVFSLTIMSTDGVILQSQYMKDLFTQRFKKFKNTFVLGNPLSDVFTENIRSTSTYSVSNEENIIFYASRFYPHKNHQFILKLVETYYDFFFEQNVKFIVTLNPEIKSKELSNILKKIEQFPTVIQNVGELDQPELVNIYQRSKVFFFPSKSETFGNGLIEAMRFGLPIVVPSLPYAKTICANNVSYYNENSLEEAFKLIKKLITDQDQWTEYSKRSKEQFENFMTSDEWALSLKKIIESLIKS